MVGNDFDNFNWELATEPEISLATKAVMGSSFFLKNKEWKKFFNGQKGRCAICGKHQAELKIAMVLDYNHVTGENRGLLCNCCNLGLGYFNSDGGVVLLEKATKYIKNYEE